MKQKIVAGNWKMNKSFGEAEELIYEIVDYLENHEMKNTEVLICPPFPYLELASDAAAGTQLKVGAQNLYAKESGAYTGEVSAAMLQSMEISYCIIGHSERRKYFDESNEMLAEKVEVCLNHAIHPIFCIGEVLEERNAESHFGVIETQLEESLFRLSKEDFAKVILAYEPVWAIGTGVTATPEQAQEMHAYIRSLIADKYGEELAANMTILYGGSCNAQNAGDLFSNPDVDGGLIGGASLKGKEFIEIIKQNDQS
jgi:triosephosphate isomerase